MPQATSELYLKFVAQGVQESSRYLEGFARAATQADAQFKDLQRTAGTAWARNMARESAQATAQLERMKRVLSEGKVSVFFSDLTRSIQGIGRVGTVAFGTLSAGIAGYVRSGMQGTAESLQLNRAMTDISYSIASIFTPQIRAAVDWVQKLSYHLMNLTGSQQASARQWVAGALSLTGFLALLPRLTGGLAALTRRRGALGPGALGLPGVGGVAGGLPGMGLPGMGGLPIIGGLLGMFGPAGGLVAFLGATREGREALADLMKATVPLTTAFSKMVPLLAAVSSGLGTFLSWLLRIPGLGTPGGGLGPLGGAGLGALFGSRFGPLGAGIGAGVGFLATGISNTIAGRPENVTDVDRLRAEIGRLRKELEQPTPLGPGQLAGGREAIEAGIARREARIKELEKGKPKDQLEPLTPGFERPEDLYKRIAEAASGDKGPAEKTAEGVKQLNETVRAMLDALRATGMKIPLERPGEE